MADMSCVAVNGRPGANNFPLLLTAIDGVWMEAATHRSTPFDPRRDISPSAVFK
jgi:hypothetical protein